MRFEDRLEVCIRGGAWLVERLRFSDSDWMNQSVSFSGMLKSKIGVGLGAAVRVREYTATIFVTPTWKVGMNLIDQLKANKIYYILLKIFVITILGGFAFFMLIWIGIWLNIDGIRIGGMILFLICFIVAFFSYVFALVYALFLVLKKVTSLRKK